MRVLIYNEAARDILDMEREAGNHASLRTADIGLFRADQIENAERVHCWSPVIAEAYEGRCEVIMHGEKDDDAPVTDEPQPTKRKRRK
ncbi:MAG: hypothetical protein E6Q97_30970 [Desulfurellales bacterium]|nr:MAG: hypothetical protein E6Q97_30970 [Desulfurellales bacterium]